MLAILLGVAGAVIAFWRSSVSGPWATDAGYLFDSAWRIQQGEVPYRDFFLLVTPGTHYTLAALLSVFGDYFVVSRVYVALQVGVVTWLTADFSKRLGLSRAAQVAVAAFQIIWAPGVVSAAIWYDGDVTAMALAAGCALARALQEDSAPWYGAAGALCGLAAWFKQDVGAGCLLGGCLAGLVAHWRGCRGAWALFAGAGAALVIPAAYLVYVGAGPAFWERAVWRAISYKIGAHAQANHQWAPGFVDRSVVGVVTLYALAPILAWRRGLPGVALVAQLWFWALMGALASHHFQGYTTKMAAFGVIMAILWGLADESPRLRLALAALMVAAGLRATRYWQWPDPGSYALQSPRLEGLRVPANMRGIDQVVARLEALPIGKTALVPNGIIAYFGAKRRNPTPLPDETGQEFSAEDGAAVAHRLWWERPQLLIEIGGSVQPALASYARDHFRPARSRRGSVLRTSVATVY